MSDLSDAYEEMWDGQLACFDSETVTISAVVYACSRDDAISTNENEIGGLIPEPSVRLFVKKSLFASPPSLYATCTFLGRSYKLGRLIQPADNTVYILELVPKER
jgi:hypothetical protein